MKNKKSYQIDLEDIVLRRAKKTDNFEEIAKLIYQTDPYIYPYWFDNDLEEAKKVLVPLMKEEGFIFNYENFYIAYDTKIDKIVAAVGAIDPTTNLDYDYSKLESVNEKYKFTIDNYLKVLIKEVQEKKYMYITNLCVDANYRSKKIGSTILKHFISIMHREGFDEIGFDCLMHNLRAKNLYHSLGFKEVADGIGFDGTEYSTVEIVFFKKKNTPFTEEDFQMMPRTSVKERDLARERLIFDNLKKKESM